MRQAAGSPRPGDPTRDPGCALTRSTYPQGVADGDPHPGDPLAGRLIDQGGKWCPADESGCDPVEHLCASGAGWSEVLSTEAGQPGPVGAGERGEKLLVPVRIDGFCSAGEIVGVSRWRCSSVRSRAPGIRDGRAWEMPPELMTSTRSSPGTSRRRNSPTAPPSAAVRAAVESGRSTQLMMIGMSGTADRNPKRSDVGCVHRSARSGGLWS